ncbi:hypothetical protein LTSERUB_6793 [Salmonella enterica subsp. enterica serovar Rubislaw str. A4-653]|uniref:Uncharacterized protein n=1 Tax=Salmonella enterica subsp. enterica serovar Rubislaw str. A4-653 TaxID=913081 RepID=G5QCS9_SALRU|nr:hypothetical protein LTSERUB_6793 [Salmonella enterica subsp. enterica serovar Rubislaw str. A4-653]
MWPSYYYFSDSELKGTKYEKYNHFCTSCSGMSSPVCL